MRPFPAGARTYRSGGGFDGGKKKVKSGRLTVVNADCAGVDVGKSYHYVAVDPERFENPVRKFGSFTSDLSALAQWLSACG